MIEEDWMIVDSETPLYSEDNPNRVSFLFKHKKCDDYVNRHPEGCKTCGEPIPQKLRMKMIFLNKLMSL
jgi:hypothetical protein